MDGLGHVRGRRAWGGMRGVGAYDVSPRALEEMHEIELFVVGERGNGGGEK